ncbi:MAG: NHL repeat-containing protein [candidate division FCPU426 bacterium]
MATKRKPSRTQTKPAARKSAAARKPAGAALKTSAAKAAAGRKPAHRESHKTASGGNRGLVFFGAIAVLVVAMAVVAKLRQGPPVKLLPAEVLGTYTAADNAAGALSSPRGIAVTREGEVVVADLGNHRIVAFAPDGSVADTWGRKGTAAGEFNEPSGVAVDSRGDFYVADTWNGRIQKFSPRGEYFGEITSKTGNFYSPRNVAVDSHGFVYVADTGNSCVKKFDTDANLVKRWGEYGSGHDRFQETFGLAVDAAGQVYVGDAGNRRIKIYTSDGKFLRDLRVKGWQSGVGWPMLALDAQGRVYATDVQHNMVWIYSREGKYLGSFGNQPGKELFSSPLGIAIGPDGSVYVSNMNRGEILKLKGLAPEPPK